MTTIYELSTISAATLLNNQGGGITAGSQDTPAVTALAGNRYAAAWVSNGAGSNDTVQFGIFSATTQSLVSAGITSLTGGTDFYDVCMALLPNGNVALAWAQNAGPRATYWTAVVDGVTGATIAAPTAVGTFVTYSGSVSIAARADGYLLAYSGEAVPNGSPALVAGFTLTGAADPAFATFTGMDRPTGIDEVAIAVLTNGSIVVAAEGDFSILVNGRGGNLGFRIFNADGTPALRDGQPIFLDVVGAYVDSRIAIAALPNGNWVLAFDQGNLSTDSNKIVVQVFSPLGRYIGGLDTSDAFIGREDLTYPSIAVIGDTGFAVSWSQRRVSDGEFLQTYIYNFLPDGTANSFVSTTVGDFGALVGFSDGRLILVAEGGNDGAGAGITAERTRLSATLQGGAGADELNGSELNERILGRDGADVLRGMGGDDGIAGDDSFTVGGADVIAGGDGQDGLSGMAGDDTLFGGSGNDTLDGGEGRDVLYGDGGNDSMEGGRGDDLYVVDAPTDVVLELANQGIDTVYVTGSSFSVPFHVEEARLFGTGTTLTVAFEGNPGGSVLPRILVANPDLASSVTGGRGADAVWGGNAGDTLRGGNGDDIIRGQGGNDQMEGGAGNDQFVVNDLGDTILESALDGGSDVAWVDVDGWTLSAEVETAYLVRADATLNGNAGNQAMAAFAAGGRLNGLAGNDQLYNGAAGQVLDGGDGDDVIYGLAQPVILIGGEGIDQFIVRSVSTVIIEDVYPEIIQFLHIDTAWYEVGGATMAANVEIGRLVGTAQSLTGNGGAEQLVANQGLGGTLAGAGGDDTLWGSVMADTLIGGAGDDVIYSYGGADLFRYAAQGWGFDQVAGFDRVAGARFDLTGSGLTFQDLVFTSAAGNTQFATTQDRVLVYGVGSLTASDFIF